MNTGHPSPADPPIGPTPDLGVALGALKLQNPIMPASGTYDWHPDDGHPLHPDELGAVVTKSITLASRKGNPPHRIFEMPGAVLNSIGIPSQGFDYYQTHYLRPMTVLKTRLITSIAGFSAAEFAQLCALLDAEPRVDAVELNLSCPNIETDSIFATDLEAMAEIIRAAREKTRKPLIAKLSPAVVDIAPFAQEAERAGADVLCIANTFSGIVIDVNTMKPVIGNTHGGVTGPGLLPIVLNHVWHAAAVTSLPIIASGGVFNAEHAVQYLLAGAAAVQVGTASFKDPLAMRRVLRGLTAYLQDCGIVAVADLVGRAHALGAEPRQAAGVSG